MPNDPGTALTPMRNRRPLMIKGLTPTLPERGKIKIGSRGEMRKSARGNEFQPPQKLDHFVVTTLQRGEDGNFIPDDALMQRLGDKPTEIPVRLLYDDPTLNFPTRYACFVGRSLWCSGDGEVALRAPATPGGPPQEVACTCERADPAYKGNDKCKMNGSLSVLIEGAGGIGGVWKFRTTSYNSIVGIMSTLAFIRQMTGGVLANIPLKLKVQPKQAAAPDGNPVTIYVVSLEFDGDMPGLQEIAHGIALGRAKMNISIEHIEDEARRMLALAPPAHVPLAGDDANDVVEEFYPEQVTAEPEPPRGRDGGLRLAANQAALRGTDSFRAWWKSLSRGDRDDLKSALSEYQAIAGKADAEMPKEDQVDAFLVIDADGEEHELYSADEATRKLVAVFDDAARRGPSHLAAARENNAEMIERFGDPHPDSLPVDPETLHKQRKDAALPEDKRSPEPTPGGEPAMADMLGADARPAKSLRFNLPRNPTERTWQEFSDFVDVTLADGESGRAIRGENLRALEILKTADVDLYDAIQGRLGK